MRLCCNCFEELLDKETVCPICNNNMTLDDNQVKEFYRLVEDIRTASKIKQFFMKKESKYRLAFNFIEYRKEKPKNNKHSYTKILDFAHEENTYESHEEYWERINKHTINKPNTINCIPQCPICGSQNVQKITITTRAVKTAAFGVIGAVDDAGKTYKCKNCGSKF